MKENEKGRRRERKREWKRAMDNHTTIHRHAGRQTDGDSTHSMNISGDSVGGAGEEKGGEGGL